VALLVGDDKQPPPSSPRFSKRFFHILHRERESSRDSLETEREEHLASVLDRNIIMGQLLSSLLEIFYTKKLDIVVIGLENRYGRRTLRGGGSCLAAAGQGNSGASARGDFVLGSISLPADAPSSSASSHVFLANNINVAPLRI
jgi:hypothetical protein